MRPVVARAMEERYLAAQADSQAVWWHCNLNDVWELALGQNFLLTLVNHFTVPLGAEPYRHPAEMPIGLWQRTHEADRTPRRPGPPRNRKSQAPVHRRRGR